MMNEKDYEEYKKKAMNRPRVYVSWQNAHTHKDCRQIGPSSACFCSHRYNQHATEDATKMQCKFKGCKCSVFSYLPVRGTQDIRCSSCKKSYTEHSAADYKCLATSSKTGKFTSSYTCDTCMDPLSQHVTIFESRAERLARGKPVDNLGGGGQVSKLCLHESHGVGGFCVLCV